MHVFAKLYATCITIRLEDLAQTNNLRSAVQCGFRPGFRLEDHCLTLRSIVQRCLKIKSHTFILFIDI